MGVFKKGGAAKAKEKAGSPSYRSFNGLNIMFKIISIWPFLFLGSVKKHGSKMYIFAGFVSKLLPTLNYEDERNALFLFVIG